MATKTFEELKQLAIQIRDEKTNKQNTATRIGTQMLEHLDKIEQDYYDKTATDEELKERDEKLTELEKKVGGVGYVTCDTDAGTAAKVVTVTGLISLTAGIRLLVKMTNNNIASNATLNINGLGAKVLYYNNTRVSASNSWKAGDILDIYYYNNGFYIIDSNKAIYPLEFDSDIQTTYSKIPLSLLKKGFLISFTDNNGDFHVQFYNSDTISSSAMNDSTNWIDITNNETFIENFGNTYSNAGGVINKDGLLNGAVTNYAPNGTYTYNKSRRQKYIILDCKEGETISLHTYSEGNFRPYSFANEENKIISGYIANPGEFNGDVVVPYRAKKIIINYAISEYDFSLKKQGVNTLNIQNLLKKTDTSDSLVGVEFSSENVIVGHWTVSDGNLKIFNENNSSNPYYITIQRLIKIPSSKEFFVKNSDIEFSSVLFYDGQKNWLGLEKNLSNVKRVTSELIPDTAEYYGANFSIQADTYSNAIEKGKEIVILTGSGKNEELFNTINFFSVEVNGKSPILGNLTLHSESEFNDDAELHQDYCLCMLPEGHTSAKQSIKAVIMFHGSGEPVYSNKCSLTTSPTANFFLKCGYAVIAVNGLPEDIATDNSLPYGSTDGNWMCIESASKALEYVSENYNVDISSLFVYGESQGGMCALNFIENGGIRPKAVVLDSPVVSMKYHQLNLSNSLPGMKYFYGINNADDFTQEKCIGLDPFSRNCSEVIDADSLQKSQYILLDSELEKIKSTRYTVAPIKIFAGTSDGTCPPYPSQIMAKQMRNAGFLCIYNLYTGLGHCIDQKATTIGTFQNNSGTYNINQPIIDMANWFARFGGYKTAEFVE